MGEIESFDRYTVVSRIACGSYGCTYEVQSETGEHLALKWLRSDPADHARERFTNEVWALRQLTHPCIPHFVGQGCRDDRPFIVMSLARGETLRRIVERQSNEQGPMSQQRLLGIIEQVLSALEHMHSLGIFHRDVKDDNIIANPSESQVTLVDLGVCKGVGQPVDAATFWNAGASRYSPPSKLKNPTAAQASHDVFAVGVTAYLLLTNNYPWTVGLSEDRGHLEDLMRSTNPAPVSQRNPFVSREVSDFVMSLLATDDAQRPTATESLNKVREIRTRLSERVAPPAILAGKAIQFPRVIRDSLHGDILMTEFEWKLIDTPEFQRLRWVRQLGTSHLVYPGAEHTRFSHALGTLFVTEQILHKIEQRTGSLFEPEERLMARIYALLHDITHIAYGHTLEDELNLFHRHDRNDQRIQRLVLDDKSSLGDLLRSESYGQIVLAHFDSASTIGKQSWLQELVESPSGADVIDYIERDSLHCGLDHKVDSAIFRRFSIGGLAVRAGPESRHFRAQLYSRKGFRLDAEFALESILLERLGLFMKVYTHPVKTAAGCMIGKALFEARRDDKDVKLSERAIEQMGDLELLLQLRNSANSSAKHLATAVMQRNLYEPAFRARALSAEQCKLDNYNHRHAKLSDQGLFDPAKRSDIETQIARRAGLKAADIIVYCPPRAPGIQKVRQYVESRPGGEELRDEAHAPHLRMFAAHLRLWTVFVFAPPQIDVNTRNRVAEASESILGLTNDITFERRQLVLQLG